MEGNDYIPSSGSGKQGYERTPSTLRMRGLNQGNIYIGCLISLQSFWIVKHKNTNLGVQTKASVKKSTSTRGRNVKTTSKSQKWKEHKHR